MTYGIDYNHVHVVLDIRRTGNVNNDCTVWRNQFICLGWWQTWLLRSKSQRYLQATHITSSVALNVFYNNVLKILYNIMRMVHRPFEEYNWLSGYAYIFNLLIYIYELIVVNSINNISIWPWIFSCRILEIFISWKTTTSVRQTKYCIFSKYKTRRLIMLIQ